MRILVVDDDAGIRRLVGYVLGDEGYVVDEAPDGKTAMAVISRHHPDIIILDMKMPGMDGWEFARVYREQYGRQAPIIVLTAAQDAAERASDVSAEGYLPKPFDIETLLARISAMMKL
jgi:DNA-binding response OmpR family regulator